MGKKILLFLFSICLVLSHEQSFADIPPKPSKASLVNDFSKLLSQQEVNQLEQKLHSFHHTTSNQILIITVDNIATETPATFAFGIGETWGVGQQDFNNGVVILVNPKSEQNQKGQTYIAVGYGLEGAIPDATAKRIVENELIPAFRQGDYFRGLDQATTVLMELAAGEITAEGYNRSKGGHSFANYMPILIIIIVVILIRMSRRRSDGMGSRSDLPFWTALWLGSTMNSRSHGGSWNSFGGGSGFGGGSSFGGFGGGSFGGGGAGGSW